MASILLSKIKGLKVLVQRTHDHIICTYRGYRLHKRYVPNTCRVPFTTLLAFFFIIFLPCVSSGRLNSRVVCSWLRIFISPISNEIVFRPSSLILLPWYGTKHLEASKSCVCAFRFVCAFQFIWDIVSGSQTSQTRAIHHLRWYYQLHHLQYICGN